MSQSLVQNLIHLVFSTKHRREAIAKDVRERLFAYQAGVLRELECPALVIGGVEDHVHMLFALSKKQTLVTVVEEVKKSSSKWMKSDGSRDPQFYWQSGYGAFSVSESNVARVRAYIENQEQRHARMSFQEELRKLCQKHGLNLDERYAWD